MLERLHDADPRVRAVRFKRNAGQHPAMHAGLARARGEIVVTMDGDLQNAARGHPAPRRGGRGRLGRRERPPRRAPRLVGPHAALARDQRHAAPLHEGRHLRLRLRLQRVPPRRRRADARRDRPPEVHEGADPLRRRERGRGGRVPRAARRRLPLLAVPARPPRAPRRRRLLAPADPVGRDHARAGLHPARDRRSGSTASSSGSTSRTSPARSSAASRCSSCSGSRASSLRSSASIWAESRRKSKAGRCTRSRGSFEEARPGDRRRRVHLVHVRPPPAGAHRPRGGHARRAHLRGQPREPRRRARASRGSRSSRATSATRRSSATSSRTST